MQIHETIDLDQYRLDATIKKVRSEYELIYGREKKSGIYSKYDWARISYAFNLMASATSALDVGIGAGQMINTLALSGRFESVYGLDKAMHGKFVRLSNCYEIRLESIDRISFDDRSFDSVTCMEVLEHLNPRIFHGGLEQLRRICKGQLIMTVPYNEPLPLPKYHKMQFTDAEIEKFFPNARKHLLIKPNVAWIVLEERIDKADVGTRL